METTAPPAAATHDYSAPMRLWHWLNAALVSGQLLTILFLKVIVNPRAAVREVGAPGGSTLTEQQGRAVAHAISERIWDWHIWIGLALAATWLGWTLMQALDPAGRRFGARLRATARRVSLVPPAEQGGAKKALFAKLTYAIFYLAITTMVMTGLALTWADDVPWLGRLEHTVKEIHNVTMYVIIAYTLVHIVGVLWAELTKDKGLISRMVSGE
ncbi:MAG: cytochrome b/b6 domain-containing protein [Janthinobacterium lividum]